MKKVFFLAMVVLYVGAAIPPMYIQAADMPPKAPPQVLHLRITAYASVPDETDSTPFITASGERVRDGIVATNLLSFGTKVEIPSLFGDKIFTVEDRMNRKMGNSLDIWMETKAKALFFGVHYNTNVVVVGAAAMPAAPVAVKG